MTICGSPSTAKLRARIVLVGILLISALLAGSCLRVRRDYVIRGRSVSLSDVTKTVRGDVLIQDAKLVLARAQLVIELPFDEAHAIRVLGKSALQLSDSRVSARPYQTFVELRASESGSPVLESFRTDWLNHAGIRLYDDSRFRAVGGEVAELQVHDSAQAFVKKAFVYPVFFPGPGIFRLQGLRLGDNVSFRVAGPTGWVFRADSCVVSGYQLDVQPGSEVTLEDCLGVGLSLHSTGTAGRPVVLTSITSPSPQTGEFHAFGATLHLVRTQIATLNIYTVGSDSVQVVDTWVNEAQTDDSSRLVIQGGQCYFNLVQARDASLLELHRVRTAFWPDSSGASVLATDGAKVILKGCNVAGLTLTAAGRGRIELVGCRGVNEADIRELDEGKVVLHPIF